MTFLDISMLFPVKLMGNEQLIVIDQQSFNAATVFKKVNAVFKQENLELFCVVVRDVKYKVAETEDGMAAALMTTRTDTTPVPI